MGGKKSFGVNYFKADQQIFILPVHSRQKIRHADVNAMTIAQGPLGSPLESMILSKVLIKGLLQVQYQLSFIDIILGVSSITTEENSDIL